VPVARAADATVVVNAYEHDAPVTVRETHHCVHEVVVRERRVRLRNELSGELFAGGDEPAKFCVGEQTARVR
jgi:hypothetical protein